MDELRTYCYEHRIEEIPALIEGAVPLPPMLALRSMGALERLYKREHVSAHEISCLAGASRSGVLKAPDRFGIPRNDGAHERVGPVPFGFDYINHQLEKNNAEQVAITKMRSTVPEG